MLLLVVFALVNVAVLALRRERVEHRHFETPRVFPILGLVISATLFAKQVADGTGTVFGIFGALLGAGVLLWLGARYFSGWARPISSREQ
jgi:APA family basic amino acid/polyamine antiporter